MFKVRVEGSKFVQIERISRKHKKINLCSKNIHFLKGVKV
jgi:hypothetical protein